MLDNLIVDNIILDRFDVDINRFNIININDIADSFLSINSNNLFSNNINDKYCYLLSIFMIYLSYSILNLDILVVGIINILPIRHSK